MSVMAVWGDTRGSDLRMPALWEGIGDWYGDARERAAPVPLLDEAEAALVEVLGALPAEFFQRHAVEMHCRREFRLSPVAANRLMNMHGATIAGGSIWCAQGAAKAWPSFLDSLLKTLPLFESGQSVTMEDVIAKMPGVHAESINTALWWLCDHTGQAWCIERREPWQRRSREQGPKLDGWRRWQVYVRAPENRLFQLKPAKHTRSSLSW